MRPFINNGEVIDVEPLREKRIRPGDIIFYRAEGNRLIAHRVVKELLRGGRFVTKGDWPGLRGVDEPVERKDILGLVTVVRKGGLVLPLAGGLWWVLGRVWMAAAPVLTILYAAGRRLKHSLKTPP